jgi:DNA-binding PadR family transcriptional regulator
VTGTPPQRASRTNDAALLIMTSLAGGPKHGYALLKDIEDFAGTRLGPGTLYGGMSRREGRGGIEPLEPNGKNQPYRLPAAGREALATTLEALGSVVREASTRLGIAPMPALKGAPA